MRKSLICLLSVLFLFTGTALGGGFKYKIQVAHEGCNVTPSQAYEMAQRDQNHTFLVDTRTRAEYQLIGHPVGAYNIPFKFWNGKLGEKKYGMTDNSDFGKDLLTRFNPATDKLIFMCRSGKRSCFACITAIKAGWAPKNVCNMLGGFEGDKVKGKSSIYSGQRKLGGWRNEGLPWTYHIDKKLVHQPDLAQ